jgi:hypothetical protein
MMEKICFLRLAVMNLVMCGGGLGRCKKGLEERSGERDTNNLYQENETLSSFL